MKIIRFDDKESWLKHRITGIGSSDVPVILGASPYMTPYQLWEIKKGITEPQEQNKYMKAGVKLEPVVAQMFFEEHNVKSIQEYEGFVIFQSEEKPYLHVSPDRIYTNDIKFGLLEIKTTQYSFNEVKENIPQHWLLQTMYQYGLLLDIVDECYIAYFCRGLDFGYEKIEFNKSMFDYIIEKVDEFYERYILGNEIPEMNADDVERVFVKANPDSYVYANNEIIEYINKTNELKSQIKNLESIVEELESRIKLYMKDNESIIDTNGNVLVTWKNIKQSYTFDKSRFEKENPELFKSYLKESNPTRQFRIKTKNE